MAPSSFNGPTLKVDIEARMSAAGRQVLEALKRTRLTVDRIPLVSALRDCNSTNAATAHAKPGKGTQHEGPFEEELVTGYGIRH